MDAHYFAQNETPPERVIGVIRLSDKTDVTTSPKRQRASITNAAAARSAKIVGWAEDIDVSASQKSPWERPELARWLARPDDWDALMFWRLDRFVRKVSDFAEMIKWCHAHNKNLISSTETIDIRSPIGRVIAYIVSAFAEMEAEAIRERVTGSHDYLRRHGRWGGGLAPYGYRAVPTPDGNGVHLVEDPPAAEIVREIAERVIARESYVAIAADLQKRGVPCPTNQRHLNAGRPVNPKIAWTSGSVAAIIQSERVRGRVEHHGEVVRDDKANAVLRGPELVDAQTWHALQLEFQRRALPDQRRAASAHPLLGVVFCASCNDRMYQGWATEKGRKDRRTYVCRSRYRGRHCPAPTSVSADAVDRYTEEKFLEMIGSWPVKTEAVDPGEDHRQEIEEIENALDRLETDRYERGLFRGPEGAIRFERRHKALSAKLDDLKQRPYQPPTSKWVDTGRTYVEEWANSKDSIERRNMLIGAGCRVDVRPTGRGKRNIGSRLSFSLGSNSQQTLLLTGQLSDNQP
ncbi:recombinase family protein [Streptomyces sp. NBC_00873]|uniref:recombinase family protein n=1 Tax=unclassified Streptomyces TaxID=2593676 RepID=UPI00386F33F8|nr:recombinase family protein [Streptomyces sp. NBC_00873]WTA47048.1 recombinase family protein [Streptomyces sp. NBC_00842]